MKKESRVQKILMLILSFTLLTTSLLASTISRYVSEEKAPFGEDTFLDYTVNSVFVVKNQEELFSAINQGYTYVQLDQNIENPLIVTQKAENLDADLILDLNGIEIQRNGYEPILNIKPGVRLTVVDTSAEQTGGLYNPVGSVFNITGGTLTVVTGTFESGPRYSEYYSYNNQVLNANNNATDRTVVEPNAELVNIYYKHEEQDGSWYFDQIPKTIRAPIIKSYPERIGGVEYTHGNLYFDQGVTTENEVKTGYKKLNVENKYNSYPGLTIDPDTYCYYRTSEDKAAEVNNEAAADWFYTYYVNKEQGFNYYAASVPADQEANYIKVTIYGYKETIEQASEIAQRKDYYAAIQMQSGTLDVQNGGFYSYFGVDRTACVNSQGGTIKIKKGKFSSRIPNANTYAQNGVNVKELDESAFDDDYFNNYNWSSDTVDAEYRGNLARQGESYCILNGGNATVSIGTGELYSSNNGIISMHGGELSILGGNFTKRITNGRVTTDISEMSAIYMESGDLTLADATCNVLRYDPSTLQTAETDNMHAIYMLNGELQTTNTSYLMNGNRSTGIKMLNGRLNVAGGVCNIQGSNTYGIYSTVQGDENFHVDNTSFSLQGDNSTGIYAERGRVNVLSDSLSEISIEGKTGRGIHVANKGSVDSINYAYTLNGDGSIGILAENSAKSINVENGDISIVGATSFGIKSSIASNAAEDNFTVTNSSIVMSGGGANQTGIYSAFGKVIVNASTAETISTSGNNGKGIHVLDNGSVVSTNYSYSLNGSGSIGIFAEDDATGINVTNGEMSIIGSNAFGIQSSIRGDDKFTVTNLPIIMDGASNQTGIYSSGGKVIVNAIGESKTISTNGSYSKGIHVASGGSVVSTNYNYSLTGSNSIGILAQADATGINVTNGKMDIKGYRSFGIHSSISGTNTFTVTNVPISMTDGEEQTGIYAQNGRVNISAGSSTTISIDDNNGKGVHVGSGGSVVSSNYSYSLNGDNSYGIYSTGGLVKLTGGDITLTSNQSCYGVYAFSASTTDLLNILIDSATINVGYTNNPITKSGSVNSCIGVFLATKNNSNFIDLINANIYSFEVGVALCGGALNFEGQGSISTNLASAIAVKGGNITFKNKSEGKYITNADSNYVITSNNTTTNQATNAYTIKLPNFNSSNEIEYSNYQNTDGIYVEGGAFVSNGDLQLTHTGLRNPTTDINNNNYNYTSVRVTSYAVRVLGGNVNILKGDIKAIIGGGIYSGSINDVSGNITMGNNSTQESDITVTADGALSGNIFWATIRANTGSWSNRISLTGGNAIELAGGNITIYNGYYESQFLNGVAANSSGVINIYNGKFFGWMNNSNNNGDMKPSSNSRKSGPSAHYGLKVIGGATVNIFGGIFDGGNGGAFVTGVDSSTIKYTNGTSSTNVKLSFNANGPRAQVYIYGGTFGDPANIGKDIQALDGFNVYDHSTVIFGAYRAPNSTGVDSTLVSPYTNKTEYQQGIVINAENATIAANPIAYATAANSGTTKSQSIITIYYGTYNLGRSGIYNDGGNCANIKIYNTNNAVGYTLRSGGYTTLVNNRTARYYPYANNN